MVEYSDSTMMQLNWQRKIHNMETFVPMIVFIHGKLFVKRAVPSLFSNSPNLFKLKFPSLSLVAGL